MQKKIESLPNAVEERRGQMLLSKEAVLAVCDALEKNSAKRCLSWRQEAAKREQPSRLSMCSRAIIG